MSFVRSRAGRLVALAVTLGALGLLSMAWRERAASSHPPAEAASALAESATTPVPVAASPVEAAATVVANDVTRAERPAVHLGLLPPMHEWRALFTTLELGLGGSSLQEHLARARTKLQAQYEPRDAARLADAYASYARYQLAIESAGPGPDASLREQQAQLEEQRALALRMLPLELAEATVLPRLERRAYLLRRAAITEDDRRSIAEKQRALDALPPPGEGASPVHSSPLAAYREQLRMHGERLRNATPSERAALLAELRERSLGVRLQRSTTSAP